MLLADQRFHLLHRYFFVSYLFILALSSGFIDDIAIHDLRTGFFVIATLLSASFFYLLPAIIFSKLVHFLLASRLGGFWNSTKNGQLLLILALP